LDFTKLKIFISIFALSFLTFSSSSQVVETPEINYITINNISGKPIVSWIVNDASTLNGYIIKRYIYSCTNYNPNWHTIKTIEDRNQLTFHDNTTTCIANPEIRKEMYSIRAYKISGSDTIKSSISQYHQTIFLEVEYDYCKKSNTLKWNNYIGWGSKFEKYDVFCKKESENFIKIGSTLYNDTIFEHLNVENNTNYRYYIKAIRSDLIESMSNNILINTKTINFPEYLNIDSLIVDNNINIYFNVDKNSDTERYILYKSKKIEGTYDSISSIDHTDINNLYFKDNYEHERYYYYLSAIDYCNNETFKSDIISNIKLSVNKKNLIDKISILKWENKENIEYKIVRCQNKSCYEINTTYNLTYIDNLQDVFENQFTNKTTSGKFCYYIINETDTFVNKSNTECVIYDETIFLANAFNPNSNIEENRTFKPKIAFIDNYELIIYGNYGNIIFQTKNPNEGWNGKLPNGKIAQRAEYMYFISYTNSYGKKIKQKGMLSLVY